MQTSVQNYYDQRIFTFTFEGITADTNDKGKVVKKCLSMPNWKQINRNNFTNYTFNHHRGLAILTGRISNITCIDFDIREEYDKLIGDHPELKNYYTVQTNKGYHIYCKYREDINTTTNAMNSYNGVDIRNDDAILYAPPTKYKIKNTGVNVEYKYIGGDILEFPDYIFDDLKQNNHDNNATQKDDNPKIKKDDNLIIPHLALETTNELSSTKYDEIEKLVSCFTKERATERDTWLNCMFLILNELGDKGEDLFLKFSQKCSAKYNEYDCKTKYRQELYNKNKPSKKITMGSGHHWAKEDDYELYKKHFPLKVVNINWDLSEAEFAKALKRICFENKPVLFTGKGKEPEGYLYNGIYWVELSLHNAELKQKHFDDLYKYYTNELQQQKDNMEESMYKNLKGQIKTLNTNKTRTNILKIFQADNYVADVKWNNNRKLFVFENCIYDLENDEFVEKPNPDDYINVSCGYKYDDTNKDEFENAKKKIKDFIGTILLESDRDYVLTLLGSCVEQANVEEKAYFLLGKGRNGKGTLMKPLENALGKYWGNLNMNYYTTHDKGSDVPNQNLYNCRNSKVLSSVEVSDSDVSNKAVKFVSDKFKTLTGNDTIYARELGTKNTAYFKAGKAFIQTNVMPVFTKLDTSLKERIVVINFPYTFKTNPVETNEKLIDMTLKTEFEKEIYKTAMINILFEYYKNYKNKGLVIPESINSFTKSYFAADSISSWIEQNLEPAERCGVDLKTISKDFEEATDKKMSVKQLKAELEELGYVVKKNVGIYMLKNWREKLDVKKDENIIFVEENFEYEEE